jgi:catechol 2,3-dioxygenase-like lactoylglutathione lyase family enzyme
MTSAKWAPALAAITLIVNDLGAAKRFYAAAFGAELVFEDANSAVFQFSGVLVNLLHRPAADELLAPSPVGKAEDAPKAVYTVAVPDTDAYCTELVARGVALLNGPVTRPWGPRTASFVDPDGHVWEIAS